MGVEIIFILLGVSVVCLTAYKITELLVGKGKNNAEMQQLNAHNEDLRQRIENLETIITGIDSELLDGMIKINSMSEAQKNKKVIGDMAQKINDKSADSIEKNMQSVLNKVLKKIDNLLDDGKK
jgi:cell division septum initiation protein DivIVA